MTDNPQSKQPKQTSNPGKIALMGAAATVLALINMSAGSEAPSTAVRVLEYVFLAGGLSGFVGGLIMMMTQK